MDQTWSPAPTPDADEAHRHSHADEQRLGLSCLCSCLVLASAHSGRGKSQAAAPAAQGSAQSSYGRRLSEESERCCEQYGGIDCEAAQRWQARWRAALKYQPALALPVAVPLPFLPRSPAPPHPSQTQSPPCS